jgi:hypothetical protein
MLPNPFEDPVQRRRIIGYGFIVAIIAAPFLGLLYGRGLGVLIMAIALAATTFVAFDLLPTAPPERRVRLRRLGIVNAVLALVCLVVSVVVW